MFQRQKAISTGYHQTERNRQPVQYLYGNGCLRWNADNCFECPRAKLGLDCDFDHATEFKLRKVQRNTCKDCLNHIA